MRAMMLEGHPRAAPSPSPTSSSPSLRSSIVCSSCDVEEFTAPSAALESDSLMLCTIGQDDRPRVDLCESVSCNTQASQGERDVCISVGGCLLPMSRLSSAVIETDEAI